LAISLPRVVALIRKETRQMLRDRSNLLVGLLLPVLLILLFGYGLSFEVKNAPLAVVMDDSSPVAREITAGLQGSSYLTPVWVGSMHEAQSWLRAGKVDGIVRIPLDFSRRLSTGDARIQLIVNGAVSSTTASTIEGYVNGVIATAAARQMARSASKSTGLARIEVEQRTWFNPSGLTTWYLVPSLLVLVLTLIGAFLTSLLIAREWERGTLEALFVTPVHPLELLLAKLAPYLLIGAVDLVLCLLAATFLFVVPVSGSLVVIFITALLYLIVSLLFGLLISGLARNQFLASQAALLASFLPTLMLSGFVFDLRNVPLAVQIISQILPATHFMALIKTLFLVGNDWSAIARVSALLAGYALLFTFLTQRTLRKTLEGR